MVLYLFILPHKIEWEFRQSTIRFKRVPRNFSLTRGRDRVPRRDPRIGWELPALKICTPSSQRLHPENNETTCPMGRRRQKIRVRMFCAGVLLVFSYFFLLKPQNYRRAPQSAVRTPNLVHFVHGLSTEPDNRKFELIHFLAVRSAKLQLEHCQIFLHHLYEPFGEWWEEAKNIGTPLKINPRLVPSLLKIAHHAHRADFLRLLILEKHGGLYLDMDVFVLRTFDDLLGELVVLGQEGPSGTSGVSNAIIASPPGSKFIKLWYQRTMATFTSKKWNEHSIKLPQKLANRFRGHVLLQNHVQFCWPLWDSEGLSRLYLSNDCDFMSTARTVHLWHSKVSEYLHNMTTDSILKYETCFTRMARQIISDIVPARIRLNFNHLAIFIRINDLQSALSIATSWCRVAKYYGTQVIFHSDDVEHVEQLRSLTNDFQVVLRRTRRSFNVSEAIRHDAGRRTEWYIFIDSTMLVNLISLRETLTSCPAFQMNKYYRTCLSAGINEQISKFSLSSDDSCLTVITADKLSEPLQLQPVRETGCKLITFVDFDQVDSKTAHCKHIFADILIGLDTELYSVTTRLLYLSSLPSAEKMKERMSDERCSKADISKLLKLFSSSSGHSLQVSDEIKKKLILMPRALDASLCAYTAKSCGIDVQRSRTKCLEAKCCYDASRPIRCFTKFARTVSDSTSKVSSLQGPQDLKGSGSIRLRYDQAKLDEISSLGAAGSILAYFDAGYIVAVDGKIQKTGEELMQTLAKKTGADIRLRKPEVRRK